jgi:hypothetical protein
MNVAICISSRWRRKWHTLGHYGNWKVDLWRELTAFLALSVTALHLELLHNFLIHSEIFVLENVGVEKLFKVFEMRLVFQILITQIIFMLILVY